MHSPNNYYYQPYFWKQNLDYFDEQIHCHLYGSVFLCHLYGPVLLRHHHTPSIFKFLVDSLIYNNAQQPFINLLIFNFFKFRKYISLSNFKSSTIIHIIICSSFIKNRIDFLCRNITL